MTELLNNIITIEIERSEILEMWKAKVIIGFNQSRFLNRLLELGEAHLEDNKIFCLCFDTTPLKDIDQMEDYGLVLKAFPNSNRVLSKAFYIGNVIPEDQTTVATQIVGYVFKDNYSIEEIIL